MKKIFFFLGILLVAQSAIAQQLDGAWKLIEENGQEVSDMETIKIYQDGYFAFGSKEADTNAFVKAGGGEFQLEDSYTEHFDFHTQNPDLIGSAQEYQFSLDNEKLHLTKTDGTQEVWHRISGQEDDLTGNWVFTGRKQNNELSRSTPSDRRTVKILGGGHFQWIAFNSATKEFNGTGGGTYTAENGVYTENIEFFSRDDTRVGASLQFDFEIKDGEWHHSGNSSTGDPMYEIWSPYKDAYEAARF